MNLKANKGIIILSALNAEDYNNCKKMAELMAEEYCTVIGEECEDDYLTLGYKSNHYTVAEIKEFYSNNK